MHPWRLIRTPPAPGAWNMAVDEALMASVSEGGAPVLRFYRWTPACLSLGRNQPAAGHYSPDELERLGIDVVRRMTGGRAVLHDEELTYSAIVGDRKLGTPRQVYRAINAALAAGLQRLGVAAALVPAGATIPVPSTTPCFADPVPDEVAAAGAKLIGSAQVRLGGVLLQHGSLPLRPPRAALHELLFHAGEPTPPIPTLSALLHPLPTPSDLIAAFSLAWRDHVGPLTESALTPSEESRADRMVPRYEDPVRAWSR
jgi:lipoyl(octanoyl) transferase